ncbi:hypothetical protein OHA37_16105 [Streptomyces sp. NBC_00335]|uniref:hypothetical protein n=1 Tax=unclassified Streptomyces TaxID=2593676 RepID=UPI0022541F02|nr:MULTISPECIES: hypothetical protein [unclassified Streptomyces]MCX5405406.1 hypothetical protein [Streptomyces sp. NBC_00086]
MISVADAEKVFNHFGWANSVAEGKADFAAISKIQTGALLEESKARHARKNLHSIVRDGDTDFARPVFVIPTEREQPGYPRSFVVFSKVDAYVEDRATAVHHFVQDGPGGAWKAAATSWVYGGPVKAGASPARYLEGKNLLMREKGIEAPATEVVAGAVFSSRAAEDRKACGRYGDYLSFTAPNGERASEHFVQGPLTGGVVDAYNARDELVDGLVRNSLAYAPTGGDLPVVRLAGGASLVTCTYVMTEHSENKPGTRWFAFKKGSDVERMLGGSRHWTVADRRWSVTAVIEVPAQGPADVVTVNSRGAELLSAKGTPY